MRIVWSNIAFLCWWTLFGILAYTYSLSQDTVNFCNISPNFSKFLSTDVLQFFFQFLLPAKRCLTTWVGMHRPTSSFNSETTANWGMKEIISSSKFMYNNLIIIMQNVEMIDWNVLFCYRSFQAADKRCDINAIPQLGVLIDTSVITTLFYCCLYHHDLTEVRALLIYFNNLICLIQYTWFVCYFFPSLCNWRQIHSKPKNYNELNFIYLFYLNLFLFKLFICLIVFI